MSRFDRKTCPVCRKPLSEASDVVVCPVCGTPHHRACYLAKNRCGVEEYHDSGFEWHGSLPWEEQERQEQIRESSESSENGEISENSELSSDSDDFDREHQAEYPGGQTGQTGQAGQTDQNGLGGSIDLEDFLNDLKMRTMDETRGADGVSSRELSCFVGRSVMHYSQAFAVFRAPALPGQKKRRVFFNLCAGLFLPFHQFYRRMDAVGTGLAALELFYAVPFVMYQTGLLDRGQLGSLQTISNVVSFIAMAALCMFGDYLYYRFTVSRIKKIRARFDDGRADGYYEALAERGTPSWLRAIISMLAFYLAQACILFYAGRFFTGQ